MSALKPVAEALADILSSARPPAVVETVSPHDGLGRYLATDLAALRTQPPFPASAMDGYAVRAADLAGTPTPLRVIGESAAGRRFDGVLNAGEAVRIFTGAPVPPGADTVLIQENARRTGDDVLPLQAEPAGRFVRAAGSDFREGDVLLRAGTRLTPQHVALAAAMNHATLPVSARPGVAVLATGDELVLPGQPLGPDQIVASNSFAIAAMARRGGADVLDLGIAGDSLTALDAAIGRAIAARARVLVTLGGASVGDHDLVQKALAARGMQLTFWKIAMRPGKPLMFGSIGDMLVLGLPGNPVSAIVCATLFLEPLIEALSGGRDAERDRSEEATLGRDLPANDERQDYLRSSLARDDEGWIATPFPRQDSALLGLLASADALVVRPPGAAAATAGDPCRIIRL